jgi:spermidine synthase
MAIRATCAVILMGMGVLLAQIILLRELMVVFSGNELTAGIMLASWLLWTAAGSALPGKYADRIRQKPFFFALVQLLLAGILPATFLLARALRLLLGVPAGEIASLPHIVIGIFLLLIPFCLLSGLLFAVGCGLLAEIAGSVQRHGAHTVARVYACEALGAGIGGALFSYLLIHIFNPWQVCLLIAVLMFLSSMLLTRRLVFVASLGICLMIATLVLTGQRLDPISHGWGWGGYKVVASKDTIYGTITVISDGPQQSFFENGMLAFSYPDPQTAEEAAHFALLEHPRPQNLLVIGGGVGGLIGEALQHPSLRHVDYVELNPHVISLGRALLPPAAARVLDDPRVEIIPMDGRRFVRHARQQYDVIILHLPDPTTAQLNRCYTREFFAEVKEILREGGVFAFAVHSSENIIGQTLGQFLRSLSWTMREVFPEVICLPGSSARFLGARDKGVLTTDPALLVKRALARGLRLQYMRDYYLLSNLSLERVGYLKDILIPKKGVEINRDLRPICYFYDIVLWSAHDIPLVKRWFLSLMGLRVEWIFSLIAAATLLLLWLGRRSSMSPVLWAVVVTGFSQIALEVILIVCFQIIYGYLYYALGMIITAFMIGLALGGWMISAMLGRITRPVRLLFLVQGALALYTLGILPFILGLHQGVFPSALAGAIERSFPVLTLVAGFLGGIHFPLANKVYLERHKGIGRVGGLLYGIDLAGAAAGALVMSVVLVPIVGIIQGITVIVVLNLSAMLCLGVVAFKKKSGARSP